MVMMDDHAGGFIVKAQGWKWIGFLNFKRGRVKLKGSIFNDNDLIICGVFQLCFGILWLKYPNVCILII